MLGLANTVSSGSTPESKYSLQFDGTDDYVDTGNTFSTTFAGSFTISMWLKPDDGQNGVQYFLGSGNASLNDSVRAFISSGKVGFILEAHDSTATRVDTDAVVFSSGASTSWTHLAFVVNIIGTGTDKTTLLVYVNGVLVAQTYTEQNLTAAKHSQFSSDINFILGGLNNNGSTSSNSYDGKIDEASIWNAALDADNVTAIYNSGRPTNLTFDNGNYNNSSALQAYYRMGNGTFDDKANGVVHDQHAPGFGSNLIVWDGSTTGDWNETQSGNTTLSANSGNLRAAADASGAYGTSRGCTTVVGSVYRVDATINVDNASGGTGNFRVSNNISLASQIATLSTSTGTFLSYFTATATTTYVGVIDTAADDTNYMEIEKISVRQLNGLPGLTSNVDVPTAFSSDTP